MHNKPTKMNSESEFIYARKQKKKKQKKTLCNAFRYTLLLFKNIESIVSINGKFIKE